MSIPISQKNKTLKKIIKALKFSSIFFSATAILIACDKDFNTIDSDVLGKDNANFSTNNLDLQILAYNKKLEALQINDLSSNLLGVFSDPAFGETTASIITQITPATSNPNFGENTVLDSVVLKIPYYSKQDGTEEGTTDIKYTIKDSLYGNNPIKLSVYKNNYFLRDFNPNLGFNLSQMYYSKADASINNTDNFAVTEDGVINFDDHKGELLFKIDSYTPSAEAIKETTGTGDDRKTERSAPALRIKIDTPADLAFWQTSIIDKEGDPVLTNANNFRDYFRGLYFKAEAIDGKGNMIFLNLAAANITIHYTKDSTIEGADPVQGTYVLNFTGNKLNTYINNYNLVTLENGDQTNGDEKLYLKGAEGSMAVVDLFPNGLDSFLNEYRESDGNGGYKLKKLINEAHLVIYEDETMPVPPKANATDKDYHYADRIYAYDIKNNAPIIDYVIDPTENVADPLNSKIVSLGQRQVVKDGNGIEVAKYKIRITEHLNNILLRDSTNTKLGLVLSTNVNADYNPNTRVLKTAPIFNGSGNVTKIPASALLAPRGTILYGTQEDIPDNRKMKFEIFFTEPNL